MNKFSWKLGEDTVRPPATLNVLNDWKSEVTTGQKPSHVGNNVIHGNVWSSSLGCSKTWAGVAFANSTSNYICLIYVATCLTTQEDRFWTLIHGLAMIVSSSAQPKKKWNVQRGSNFETRSIYLRRCNGPGKCVFGGGPTETVEVYPRFHMLWEPTLYVSLGGWPVWNTPEPWKVFFIAMFVLFRSGHRKIILIFLGNWPFATETYVPNPKIHWPTTVINFSLG